MKWPKRKAGELFDIQLGKMLNEKARTGDTFPYLANFNVRWGKFDLSELNQMAFSDKEQEKFSLQLNDLLMCEGGEIGRCAVWMEKDSKIFYQKALHRLRPIGERVSSHFMHYYMHHLSTMGDLPKLVGETSIAHLTREKLVCLPIPVPPRAIQNKIVEILLTWDAAIEKIEHLIAAKEKRKSGLMAKFLTGKQRLNGFKASWRNAYLGELFRERVEVNWNDLPLLSITGENGVVLRSDLNRKDSSNNDKSKYLRICPGDIGYNTMRMWQGVSALSSHEGIISPAYTVCIPSPEIDGRFASYIFKLPEVIHLFYRYSQGLTSDTWNLKFRHFAEVRVYVPWVDEQIAIASVLATIDEELVILKNQRNALTKQKRGLMQKLLTGQWRVTVPTSKEVPHV